ncbi:hypothetical protein [Streptomyces scopuliridis]|uniref:hypothetical protein n=1 Tax=Streptomyces scopuliridis TaxID=452529 RepID=UPI0034124362
MKLDFRIASTAMALLLGSSPALASTPAVAQTGPPATVTSASAEVVNMNNLPALPTADAATRGVTSTSRAASGYRNYNIKTRPVAWSTLKGYAEGTLFWYGSAPYTIRIKGYTGDNASDGKCVQLLVWLDGRYYSVGQRACGNGTKKYYDILTDRKAARAYVKVCTVSSYGYGYCTPKWS